MPRPGRAPCPRVDGPPACSPCASAARPGLPPLGDRHRSAGTEAVRAAAATRRCERRSTSSERRSWPPPSRKSAWRRELVFGRGRAPLLRQHGPSTNSRNGGLRHIFRGSRERRPAEEREKVRLAVAEARDRLVAGEDFAKLAQETPIRRRPGTAGDPSRGARRPPPSIEAGSGAEARPLGGHRGHAHRVPRLPLESRPAGEEVTLDGHATASAASGRPRSRRRRRRGCCKTCCDGARPPTNPARYASGRSRADPLCSPWGRANHPARCRREWETLPFARQRLESLEDVLRERCAQSALRLGGHRPSTWPGGRTSRRSSPPARKQALIDWAFNRR